MKQYTVYLFRYPECRRGWLAYLGQDHSKNFTVAVVVEADTGAKAKNMAITASNNYFHGVEIVKKGYSHQIWGLENFHDVEYVIAARELEAKARMQRPGG